jgi:DNA replication protein DnaC
MVDRGLTNSTNRPEPTTCNECDGSIDYVWVSTEDFSYWTKEDCKACAENKRKKDQAARKEAKLKAAGVPLEFWGHTLGTNTEDKHNKHVADALVQWSPPGWVMLSGRVGTGKSSWLTSLFNSCMLWDEHYDGARWSTESRIFEGADLAHNEDGYTARQAFVRPYISAPLLFLDDIGASRRKLTEWQGSAMRNLFDERYSQGLATFITTNLTMEDIRLRYGDHIFSRIRSATGGPYVLDGPDRRNNGSQ